MEELKVKELEIDFKDIDNMLELESEDVIYKLKINGLGKKDVEWNYDSFSSKIGEKLENIYKEKGFMFDLSETKLPSDLENMYATFEQCESLVKAPVIPVNVKNMSSAFKCCYNLMEAPVIPQGVENIDNIFAECYLLIKVPAIPNGIYDLKWTFMSCKSLENAPMIPKSVGSLHDVFWGCEKLNTVEKFQDTFKKLSNTKLSVLDISKEMTSWMNDNERNKLNGMFKKMGVKNSNDLEVVLLGWKDDAQKELNKDVKIERKIDKDVRNR